jgi:hypothetical protein
VKKKYILSSTRTYISLVVNHIPSYIIKYAKCQATTIQAISPIARRRKSKKLLAKAAKPAIVVALHLWILTSKYVHAASLLNDL